MTDTTIKTIGYVGLGIMGLPMAENLIDAGYELVVYNRTASKAKPLIDKGAMQADSPAQVAGQVDALCINVTDTPDVEQILFGENGVSAGAQAGLIVIDNSTISPQATQDFAAQLGKQEVTFIDAPVSGGDSGAKAGTLSIMVGGDDAAVKKAWPIFEVLGKNITHLGAVGSGQACKACNQVAVVCNLLGVCEALALAKKTGLDEKKMVDVVCAGAGGSWQLANLGTKIIEGDFKPGFMIDLVLKDLGIVLDTARNHDLKLDGTALAEKCFKTVAENGGGKEGTQAMAKALEK